jgi:flagellum-specific ATP synthase
MDSRTPTDSSFIGRRFTRSGILKDIHSIPWNIQGKVCNVVGTLIEAYLPGSRKGSLVNIHVPGSSEKVLAEVVGIDGDKVRLLPFSSLEGLSTGCIASGERVLDRIQVGDFLLGKVIDSFLKPLDGTSLKVPERAPWVPIDRDAPNPMLRKRIERSLGLGIRAMDGFLTFGDGQRVGIMAGSGVGKSVLLGMIARGSEADVNVIGLIGERGREVREFLEKDLGPAGLARSVVVVATSDQSPPMRIRAAKVVHAIAEHFSAQGNRVLLMMDSLTRVAMAQREIGAALEEPPTTKGYTPSVFSLIPRLVERSGPQREGQGNISALYTVLVDGDDFTDPIADAARATLDGHINLSRALAVKAHYPAIDIGTSASRVMYDVVKKDHWAAASRLRMLLGSYSENIDLVQTGTYVPGKNATLDEALALMPTIERYLRQDIDEHSTLDDAISKLIEIALMRPLGPNRQTMPVGRAG